MYHSQNENEKIAQSSLEQQTKTLQLLEKELNKSKQLKNVHSNFIP
jgi:hypothetical protein